MFTAQFGRKVAIAFSEDFLKRLALSLMLTLSNGLICYTSTLPMFFIIILKEKKIGHWKPLFIVEPKTMALKIVQELCLLHRQHSHAICIFVLTASVKFP